MTDFAVQIKNLTKTFKLPHEKHSTLKGQLVNFGSRGYEVQKVLENFNLDIKKGEFLGILGRNGSGKSTLLKTLSGIYTPDSGDIHINGKLTPFIELGVGFNPELSGKDNVYLNGALLGFSRKEIDEIYEDIVEFAELERFMDQKLKNYSSGMQVRLAFSIAIRANTEILVLDEVLAVGDEAFQRKCYDYFNQLKAKGKTVILVTHDMSAVKRFCTRAVVIHQGEIIFEGDTEDATVAYRKLNIDSSSQFIDKTNKKRHTLKKHFKHITSLDVNGKPKNLFAPNEKIVISVDMSLKLDSFKHSVQIWFNNPGGTAISSVRISHKELEAASGSKAISAQWILPGIYNDGKYLVTVELSDEVTGEVKEIIKEVYEFSVLGWESPYVIVHPDSKVKVYSTGEKS
ncbi:MAG TPA: ABC transporter ATP-binding protein [Candidatus Saccharimonadaceae bacterium]|nr:ABC transporter ATP-binding protein [Candidatus Saccharimonadaceae bacterium]